MTQSNERHDHSVETAWSAMLDWEKHFSLNVLWDLMGIVALRELERHNTHLYTLVTGSDPIDSAKEQLLEGSVDRVRPFLGETLYDIFSIHRVVVFRAAADLHSVVCGQSNEHWTADQLVHNALDGLIDLDGGPDLGDVLARFEASLLCSLCGSGRTHP